MSSPRFLPSKFLIPLAVAAIGFTVCAASPVAAQHRNEQPSPIGDLQQALESAQTDARGSENLDAAYDLLGVAGTAQTRNAKAIGDKASATFADLVQRVSAAALRKGGSVASDTLDQLVDLRFFARSQDLAPAMAVLDKALASLFGPVAQTIEQRIAAAENWDDRMEALGDLASLQASAAQVLMNDEVAALSAAFDDQAKKLEAAANRESDDAERARRLAGLVEARRSRDEQIADAKTNNVDAVAAQLKDTGKAEESTRGTTGEDIPPDLMGDTSCIETAYRGAAAHDAKLQRTHDRECVDSGRVPTSNRCPTANLSLACYAELPNGEKITYVYRNTPEESYFRTKCGKDDLVPANRVPDTGATFRSRDVNLAFICAPAGGSGTPD